MASRSQFFKEGVDRVALVREALRRAGGNHRVAAVALLQRMSNEEQQQLFPELVQLARSVHGPVAPVRTIIASLPRGWVLSRIDAEVESILEGQQYDDYWMLVELLAELDHERAVNLARRAAESDDPEIRELGSDMLPVSIGAKQRSTMADERPWFSHHAGTSATQGIELMLSAVQADHLLNDIADRPLPLLRCYLCRDQLRFKAFGSTAQYSG